MRSGDDAVTARRRVRARMLLAALTGLVLIAFATPPLAGNAHARSPKGDAVVAAVLQAGAVARVLPERLDQLRPSAPPRTLSGNGLLPTSMLVALLVLLRRPRRAVTGTARQADLLSSAGRGPPLHS